MAKGGGKKARDWRVATRLVLAGRNPFEFEGFVNTPIYRGSTVLSPTVAQFVGRTGRYQYGRRGTPTTDALSEGLAELEGGAGVMLTPSGLSAITVTLLACLNGGDHVLVTDSAYGPTRQFCDTVLKRLGVETSYYDPVIGAGIEERIQAEHQGGLRRGARLAQLRNAGRAGDREGRARARCGRADGQYLGDAGLLPAARAWRRFFDSGRNQISRRPC